MQACKRLLDAGRMVGTIVRLVKDHQPRRFAAIGSAVFVRRAFLEAEKASPCPGLAERILESELEENSVILSSREMSQANATEGLNLVTVFHHWQQGLPVAHARQARMQLMTRFVEDFRGFRLRELLSEANGDEELRWAVAGGGFRLRSSYDDWHKSHRSPRNRRYLVGITREEALEVESSVNSMLFHYQAPRIGFTAAQRRLLYQALQHQTDSEIAASLQISSSAVKKHWAAVFDRVSQCMPALLNGSLNARHSDAITRGSQKRHLVIAYVREHAEELRP